MCFGPPMTDDQQRRIDGLLASYGEMRATLERLDERSSGQGDDIEALRQMYREAMASSEKMLGVIASTCEKNTDAVALTVDKQGARIDKLAEKLDTLSAARSWTPAQYVTLLGPWGVAVITVVGLVLTKGSP